MFFKILASYLVIVNVIGFASMGVDKRRAVRRLRRTPEKTLFLIAAIGGSIGSWLGMFSFRHKTKHKSFLFGIPLILVLQVALAICIIKIRG